MTIGNVTHQDVVATKHRAYYNLDSECSKFCDVNYEAEEEDEIEVDNLTCMSLGSTYEDFSNGRMRGGCGGEGGGGCCGGKSRFQEDIDYGHEEEKYGGKRSGECGCGGSSGTYIQKKWKKL